MAHVASVNVGQATDLGGRVGRTGIGKRPVDGPVDVRAPGPARGRGGVVGDTIVSHVHHGGDDQAVYAFAREDLDAWQDELGRELPDGMFGENLTTSGLDVTGALIGERWHVGDTLVLEVCVPRVPCTTFATWIGEPGWIKRFTARAAPGTYLRVLRPGPVRGGDPVVVTDRPGHGVTVGLTFRALTLEPDLLPRLLAAGALPDEARDRARRRVAVELDSD